MKMPISQTVGKTKLQWKAWVVSLIALALLMAIVVMGVLWLRHQITNTGYTTDETPKQVIIGNDVLNIPANLIRFKQQRETLTPEQVDLAIHWPSGKGYEPDMEQHFLVTGQDQRLIFVKLAKRGMAQDMSGRLEPIYKTLFEGQPIQGPSGLVIQPLKSGSGYDGEQLAIYNGAELPWVARCHKPTSADNPTCLRDLNMGSQLSVTYRFPLALLNEWNGLEQLVFNKVTTLLEQ